MIKSPIARKSTAPVFHSVEELASYLGISRQGAYSALRRGEIPHIRLGRRFVIPRAAVDEWLRAAGKQENAR